MHLFHRLATLITLFLGAFADPEITYDANMNIVNPKRPPGESWALAPIGCSFDLYYCLVLDKVGYRGWKNLWGSTSKVVEDAQTTTAWFNVSERAGHQGPTSADPSLPAAAQGRISGQAIFVCPVDTNSNKTVRSLVNFALGQRKDGASIITIDKGPIDCATSDGQSVNAVKDTVTVVVKDSFADAYIGE